MTYSYFRPDSIDSARSALAKAGPGGRFVAGGTDLFVQIKRGMVAPSQLIDIRHLPELREISVAGDISVGACTPHRDIESHTYFLRRITALCEASRVVGGVQIRNMGTIGGNLVNASPAADLNPALLALDARAHFVSDDGPGSLPVRDFIISRQNTAMPKGAVLTHVTFADLPTGSGTAFLKAGRRRAMEIALVNVAVRLTLVGGVARSVRIVLGAVGPTMIRAIEAEAELEGKIPDDTVIAALARKAAEAATPRDDVRASAAYRTHLVEVMARRATSTALDRAKEDLGQ